MKSSSSKSLRKNERREIRPLDTGLVQDNVPAQVIPGLFIGSIHAAFNQEGLHDLGVTHILNASGMPATFPHSFTYFTVSVRDKEQASILSCVPAANIFIEAGMDKGSVLVHCAGGRSRSASFVVAFLMSSRSMSYDDAVQLTRSARQVISINRGFEEQLRAYGTMSCDIYKAQQYVLRSRMKDISMLRQEFKNQIENGQRTASDPSPLIKYNKKITLPSKGTTPRPSVPSYINGQLPTARLRLSRPRSTSVQVIPPLRGLERVYVCSKCSSYLFTIANIIRTDMPVSEAVDRSIKQSMSPLPVSTSRNSSRTSDEVQFPHSNRSRNKSKSLRNMESLEALSVTEPSVPQTTKHSTQSNKDFSFNTFDLGQSHPATTRHSRKTNMNGGKSKQWDDAVLIEEDEEPSPRRTTPMQIDLPACNSSHQGSFAGEKRSNSNLKAKSTASKMLNLPHLDSSAMGADCSTDGLSSSGSMCDTSPPPSPDPTRPQSAEKRRWLQKMLLLDSSNGKRAIKAASQDEEMATISSSSFIYLEYMPWFGEILTEDQGPIICPTDNCKAEIGEYSWIEGFEVPRPMGVGSTTIGPPKFTILKSKIGEEALQVDSPRNDSYPSVDDAIQDNGAQSANKTSFPQILKKNKTPRMWLKSALSRSSSRSSSRQSSPKVNAPNFCSIESSFKGEQSKSSLTICTTQSDLS